MAMKYNASTGEWEEEEEGSSLGISNLPGAMPEIAPLQIGTGLPQSTIASPTTTSVVDSAPKLENLWGKTTGDGYTTRGDYRMDPSTAVEQRDTAGIWKPITESTGFYDSRQDSNTLDSNERRQLSYWFNNAPDNVAINDSLSWAANNGFQEPDRSGGDSFFDSLLPILAIGAGIYGGGALAGLWGGAGAAGVGAAVPGSIAAQWAALEGAPTLVMGGELAAGGAGAFSAADGFAGLPEVLGEAGGYGFNSVEFPGASPEMLGGDFNLSSLFDQAGINGVDLPEMAINGMDLPSPDAFNVFNPTDYNSLSQSLGGEGIPTETFSPDVSAFSQSAPTLPDSYSPLDGVDPFETTDMVNKDWNKVTGYGLDNMYGKNSFGLPIGTGQEIKNMLNTLRTPIGGSKYGPTPMGVGQGLAKLYSAYNSENQLKDTLGKFQGMYDSAINYQDPNRARGDEANRLWTENYNNPKAGYNEFMTGTGREFTDQARAQAAKSGRRGSYINSGKMQSDLASLWMKNQNSRGDSLSRGFSSGNNTSMEALKYTPGLMDMYNKQGGSIGTAVQDILQSTAGKGLIDNVLEGYW